MTNYKFYKLLILLLITSSAYANNSNTEVSLTNEITSITKQKIKRDVIAWSTSHKIIKTRNKIKIIFPEQVNTIKPCGTKISIEKIKGQENISKQMYFNAFCPSPKWRLTFKANILLDAKLPVLKNSLHKGDILLANNIKLKWFNINFFEREFVTNSDYLINKEATRYIAENTMVRNYQIQELVIIHAGDLVKIEAGNTSFNVTIDGIALTSGGLNKPIKVKTVNSNKHLIAYSLRKGVVRIKSY